MWSRLYLAGCGDGGGGGRGGSECGGGWRRRFGGPGGGRLHHRGHSQRHHSRVPCSIEAGARKAEKELNAAGTKVQILWKGPLREDDRDQQIQVVENFTSRRVSGIVLAPLDSQALVKPVENAVGAGIPTVIIDSDLKTDKHTSFVSTDNFRGGQMGGEHLAKLIGEKGNIILLRYAVGSASTEARKPGSWDAIKKFPNIKILSSDQYAGATRETSYQAAQNLLNRYGRDVNGVFCPCEPVAVGMAKALRDLGYAGGKVKMVGFDTGGQSVLPAIGRYSRPCRAEPCHGLRGSA